MRTLIEELQAMKESMDRDLAFYQERKSHYEAVKLDDLVNYYDGKEELAKDVISRLNSLIEYHAELETK